MSLIRLRRDSDRCRTRGCRYLAAVAGLCLPCKEAGR